MTEHPFISEASELMGEHWPFIKDAVDSPVADPRVLHCGVALAIKTLFEQADDGDTVWFWNVCKEARNRGQGAYFKADAIAQALGGLLIADPLVSRRAWNDCAETGLQPTGHFQLCAGCPLSTVSQLSWAWFFFWQEERTQWLLVRAYRSQKRRHSVLDAAAAWWENGIRRKYPNLMGDVFARYYGADHVFSLWTQGRL